MVVGPKLGHRHRDSWAVTGFVPATEPAIGTARPVGVVGRQQRRPGKEAWTSHGLGEVRCRKISRIPQVEDDDPRVSAARSKVSLASPVTIRPQPKFSALWIGL